MTDKYYYFSTHTINQSIYMRLEAGWEYTTLPEETQELLDKLVGTYPKGNFKISPLDHCSQFINKHNTEFDDLIQSKGSGLKYFLTQFLGFSFQWGASTRSFGKTSEKRAEEISEKDLIYEMTDPRGSIKKLVDSSHSNLSAVKPFLPAIMISLGTNTRNKTLMTFNHTGRFCFDFDGLKDSNEARVWMNKVWGGTKNIKPYMSFISPRGKGFKVFCKVDTSNPDFQRDFGLEEREVVMKHHKVWYEGARKELVAAFPELESKFDESTKDPQRLTYLPYIKDEALNFKYDQSISSDYSIIVNTQRDVEKKDLLKKISQNSAAIKKIMVERGINSQEDAYHLMVKDRSSVFDLELETDKFVKVVEFIEGLALKDDRVANWVYEKFNDYHTLHKISWVLYGVFGDLAIEQLKRLIPADSNKLDESNNDYRWAIRSKDDYDSEQLSSLTPAAFYALVSEVGEVTDFISENYRISSGNVSDFKLLNDYYETYARNKTLHEADDGDANLAEFLDEVTSYIDKKKVRLPLIEELDSLTSEVTLGPSEYLDKDVMENILLTKYSDKRIFSLRSQCGTGKNSISGHPTYKMKGRVILAEPFKSISDQAASEAWENGDRQDQLFVNSGVENTLRSFKKSDEDSIKVNYETTLKGISLPTSSELVIHSTYNQILNISHEDLSTIDYIFIDESHTLADGLNYRSDIISELIYYLVEFVAKKRKCKTKIIFMSGTPNVETHVIPELMDEYKIKSLFQRVIVDKKYKVRPLINLTHLDTGDVSERQDTVISQINAYIKQGRKVCHIFNNKSKMDQYIREIQSKLSTNIKVGLFYSGSTGQCTRNILSGKVGDYDVILTTTYFINGININKDGLTPGDIKMGKESSQKYGVVIDLGQGHTRVNAMDAIQAINRFRNRKCHATIFLPKIFKPDLKNSSRSFDFRNAGKTLLGINKYNYHLVSLQKDVEAYEEEEEEVKGRVFLLDSIRRNPLSVSSLDIAKATKDDDNKNKIVDMITTKSRLYEDWFCSLDGYHYLAKDAGFLSIIRHRSTISGLKEMSEEHLALENKVVENFMDDDKILLFLDHHLEPDKRVFVKSSGTVKGPEDCSVGNFKVVEIINDKHVIQGDFHISHERALNQLVTSHLRLSYWYGSATATEIIRFIINPNISLMPSHDKHHSSNISKYIAGCKNSSGINDSSAYSYLRGLDILSKGNYGVKKHEYPTFISYTIHESRISDELKSRWADYQYDMTLYKIDSSESEEKDELKTYYSNKALVKEYDLSELKNNLEKIGDYQPYRYDKAGKLISPEQIHIPRVLKSEILVRGALEEDYSTLHKPKTSTLTDFNIANKSTIGVVTSRVKKILSEIKKLNPQTYTSINTRLLKILAKGNYKDSYDYIQLVSMTVKAPEVKSELKKIEYVLTDLGQLFYSCFETAEYLNYRDFTIHGRALTLEGLFYCEDDFELESLKSVNETHSDEVIEYICLELEKSLKLKSRSKNKINNKHLDNLRVWVAFNSVNEPVVIKKVKSEFCRDLCIHAFKNEPFLLERGSPPKIFNKGIYNPNTFSRDYLNNSEPSRQLKNYSVERLYISVDTFRKFIP